jgi:four helix bundle protein
VLDPNLMAKRVVDLPVYSKVDEFWRAVNAILDRPQVCNDVDLHDEISRANESIGSNMVEGFEQGTDRAFANYFCYSKGSVAEVLKRLRKAYYKRYVTADELKPCVQQGEELKQMLGGFIKYLRKSNWVDRGSHGYEADEPPPALPRPHGEKADDSRIPKSETIPEIRGFVRLVTGDW